MPDQPPEPCTTEARRRRHYSAALVADRHAPRQPGRGGRTLCGQSGRDEERANAPQRVYNEETRLYDLVPRRRHVPGRGPAALRAMRPGRRPTRCLVGAGVTDLHPAVRKAALDAYKPRTAEVLDAVKAAVAEERRMILDVVDVMAGRADCAHQRDLVNQILAIYGRDPVDEPTLRTPDHCALEAGTT